MVRSFQFIISIALTSWGKKNYICITCLNPFFELIWPKFDADWTTGNEFSIITIYIRERMIFIPHMLENQWFSWYYISMCCLFSWLTINMFCFVCIWTKLLQNSSLFRMFRAINDYVQTISRKSDCCIVFTRKILIKTKYN